MLSFYSSTFPPSKIVFIWHHCIHIIVLVLPTNVHSINRHWRYESMIALIIAYWFMVLFEVVVWNQISRFFRVNRRRVCVSSNSITLENWPGVHSSALDTKQLNNKELSDPHFMTQPLELLITLLKDSEGNKCCCLSCSNLLTHPTLLLLSLPGTASPPQTAVCVTPSPTHSPVSSFPII